MPVNTLMTEDDYRFMLADSRARVLVVSEALLPKFEKLIGEAPDLEHVVVSGARTRMAIAASKTLIAGAEPGARPRRPRATTCFWLYSSGSTGKPKGAVHVHSI